MHSPAEIHYSIQHIWLVAIYPLIAALLIILGRSFHIFKAKEISMGLTVGATALGLLHTIIATKNALVMGGGHIPTVEANIPWIQAGNFVLSIGYLFDPMSLMMLFVVTFISMLIQIYTHGYMEKDPGYSKFFAYLALFNFSMLGLVLSTNLFQMYIFWEMVGVCSYLLIGFWFTKPSAAKAAVKAFLMNRVGDFGLLIGILSFLFFSFNWWTSTYLVENPSQALLSFQGFGGAVEYILTQVQLNPVAFGVIAFLIFMGPMAKSAQVPLHTWLPDAMEGPTPISALIHAATMVAAGIFLVGRVYPVFSASPELAMPLVASIGLATAFVAATIAITQMDIKKALAYSTVSQLGFMMVAMGVGAFSAGLFHLFTHAFFKAMLFLCSGSVIHALHDEQDMHHMGGLKKYLPITRLTYLIGTLSISGFFLSGFWSKDEILVGTLSQPIFFYALLFTAGLTAFYMFRTYFLTFSGEYRGHHHPHHEAKVMTYPLLILAVPSVLIGWLMSGHAPGFEWFTFDSLIHYGAHAEGGHGPANLPASMAFWMEHDPVLHLPVVAWVSLLVGMAGWAVAYIMYRTPAPAAVFAAEDSLRQLPGLSCLHKVFSNKYYFDESYQAFVDKVYLWFANASASFDKGQIDGVVNSAGQSVMSSGVGLSRLQTGKVQAYIAVLFYGVCVLSLVLMYVL
jgi:NAD(P)H-quinone oxidoreductase subunit 5